MKITKRQLRRIIKEERTKLLEQYGMGSEIMNPTVAFADAWSSLGTAVQQQMVDVINAYIEGQVEYAASEINPNAFDLAKERLIPPLRMMDGDDARDLLEMFDSVTELYKEMRI